MKAINDLDNAQLYNSYIATVVTENEYKYFESTAKH